MAEIAHFGTILPMEELVYFYGQEIPFLFEIQGAGSEQEILREALDIFQQTPHEQGISFEISIFRLARATKAIRGKPIDMPDTLSWVRQWPPELVGLASEAYFNASNRLKTERRKLDADPLPEALSADEHGDDSGHGISTGRSRRKTLPTSSTTPISTNGTNETIGAPISTTS